MRRLILSIAALAAVILCLLYSMHRQGERAPVPGKMLSVKDVLGGIPAEGFSRALNPRTFAFPADHGPHPGFRNEWWYFTGNLETREGRSFGYQLTFFRVALAPRPAKRSSEWGTNELFMAHFALTDVAGRRFRFAERFSRAALGLAGAGGKPLAVRLEDWTARETTAHPWGVKLSAADAAAGMAIELDLRSLTREILNGEAGLSRKGGAAGNASYYYSLPRMETAGSIRVGGESFQVKGLSWLDREWSTSALAPDQVGWDWFSLQLADGRDLMFYRLRRQDGSADPFSAGTLVAADGSSRGLKRDEVQLEVVSRWTSPASGASYPAVWRMRVPSQGIDLEITPKLADQELVNGFRYWEGAVSARGMGGTASGAGYLEMTGYPGK